MWHAHEDFLNFRSQAHLNRAHFERLLPRANLSFGQPLAQPLANLPSSQLLIMVAILSLIERLRCSNQMIAPHFSRIQSLLTVHSADPTWGLCETFEKQGQSLTSHGL